MKRWLIGAITAGLMMAGGAEALAQPKAVSAPEPSARSVELVRRYFRAMKMEQTIKPMVETMMNAMIENQLNANESLTPLQRGAVMDAAKDILAEGLVTRMMNNMAPGFAQVLTEPELEALVAFYESPEGRSVIDKMGQLQQIGTQIGMKMAPEMGDELYRRACLKIECPK